MTFELKTPRHSNAAWSSDATCNQVALGQAHVGVKVSVGQGQLGSFGCFGRSSCTWTRQICQFQALLASKVRLDSENLTVLSTFGIQVALGQGQKCSLGHFWRPSCTWRAAGQASRASIWSTFGANVGAKSRSKAKRTDFGGSPENIAPVDQN